MRRWLRRIALGLSALAILAGLSVAGGFLWLRTSLPQAEGKIDLAGLDDSVTISRDARGVPIVRAASGHDAYFALGFLHAQDRLFQMDAMRRLGAGRLAEIIGPNLLATDRTMRILGLYRSAEAQLAAASPALREALEAYSAGVNAHLANRTGALPPEFYLLGYEPEPWQPSDSLVWGRLMALDLSGNWHGELENRQLLAELPAYLFDLLVAGPVVKAAGDPHWRQPLNEASNSWSVGGLLSSSGLPVIANDPHLGLSLPATWYLAKIITHDFTWTGATAPGLPFIVIGSNGHVSWTFTTTHGDTQDVFDERLVSGRPDHYETPDGPAPFETREEIIQVKGGSNERLAIRSTRHGPVISDINGAPQGEVVQALAWTALLPDDRTPEAILAINHAMDAAALEVALTDFHAPQQNIVYADSAGITGFAAAGRVPQRRQIFENSRLPAPGWSGDYDWLGTLPFAELPQARGGGSDIIVTANADIRPPGYRHFMTADWPEDARAQRIQALLEQQGPADVNNFSTMQMDRHSAPLLAFVRRWQDTLGAPKEVRLLADWKGDMDRDSAAPLIATIWLDRTARALLADEMGAPFDEWWFWQVDRIERVISDGRACDDTRTEAAESCEAIVAGAYRQAVEDLATVYGKEPANWKWGDSHRAPFRHPVFGNVPLLADWLAVDLPTDGDYFTVNRGTPRPPGDGVKLAHVHGPGLRIVHDLGAADGPLFTLAGGQSGNPFSVHYADWLTDWRDGRYHAIGDDGLYNLILQPAQSAP